MPPLLTASAAVQLAIDGRSAGAAGSLFSHTPGPCAHRLSGGRGCD